MSEQNDDGAAPATAPTQSKAWGHLIARQAVIAAVILAAVLVWSNRDNLLSLVAAQTTPFSCEHLADEAVRISGEQQSFLTLLKVRNPVTLVDHSDTYVQPVGNGEALIKKCRGMGVWSTGGSTPVIVTATVDSDGDQWVGYRPAL